MISKRNKDGFALVLALSLMAFVVLLLLTITTYTQVETANAHQAKSLVQARQNALLGMQIALGELQKELGPDQRVTTTGARLDTDPSTTEGYGDDGAFAAVDGLNVKRQNWTGVWEVDKDSDGYVQTDFRKWLVSGYPSSYVPTSADVLTAAAALPEPQILLEGDAPVEVGLEEIVSTSNGTGRYAYWVGDEGVKAKVNLSHSTTGNQSISTQYPELSTLTKFDWLPLDSSESFEKFISAPSFEIMASASGDTDGVTVGEHIHDITFSSSSVLSNSVSGGLKRDLTSALYDTMTQPSGLMFEPVGAGGATDADPGGPDWAQLRSWVQTQPNGSGRLPIEASSATQAGVHPILTGFQLYWVPTYDAVGFVRMNLLPAVTLWNPYNVPLESGDYTIKFARTLMTGTNTSEFQNLAGLWNNWDLKLNQSVSGNEDVESIYEGSPVVFHFSSGVIEAGEAIVFSAPTGSSSYDFSNASNAELVRGYNPGSGFHYDTGLQWEAGEAAHVYDYDGVYSRVHSVELLQGGTNGDRLQAAVYIADRPEAIFFTGDRIMEPSPIDTPLSEAAMEFAYGYKILHTFIDNVVIWGSGAELSPDTRGWLSHQNPRALVHGPVPFTFEKAAYLYSSSVTLNPSYVGSLQRGSDEHSAGFSSFTSNRVPVGHSEDSASAERTVLFQSAPTRDGLHSIGQLMHAPLHNDLLNDSNDDLEVYVRNSRFGNLIPAYAIGNSLADPYIELDEVSRDWLASYTPTQAQYFSFDGVHYDYSYKLNEALWDDYFFSTLPDSSSGNVPSNARLVGEVAGADPLVNEQQAAADLLIDGGFNINSTSVEAWRALLASFYSADVVQVDGTIVSADLANPESPILRVDAPVGTSASAPGVYDDESYLGYRSLTEDQIDLLAEKIVEQVKLRGPFGGLAQFVNRMPTRDGPGGANDASFRLEGALTAAIENAGINASLMQDANLEIQPSGIPHAEIEAEAGWRTEGLPGWLTQADLLARLGAVLTARSDTFRIRSYGEYESPVTGELVWARCEAVVQRIPEYVDADDNTAWTDGATPLTPTNETFGRRFIVIDFQWLEDDEV
ncbi:hypothetical protein ACWPKS_08850 [Coraliomargarita sp. W4R72]